MKNHRLTILAACTLILFLYAGCSAHPQDAPAEPPAPAEESASHLSADTPKNAAPKAETKTESPQLTLDTIRKTTISDVPADDIRLDYIKYAVCRGYLHTGSDNCFSPDAFVTRGDLMDALWHISGEDAPTYDGKFTDVARSSPLAQPVAWAVNTGIAAGSGDGTFSPQTAVSREQLAVFLSRFASAETTGTSAADACRDAAQVSSYARAPLAWALSRGLFSGMVSDTIHPSLPVSRAQLAQVLTAYAACTEKEPLAQTLASQLKTDQTESASLAHHDEIQKQIDAVAAKYGAMGLQAAVVENGIVTDTFSYGWAVKDSAPMTAEYKIRSASISKVAVGMAAMILAEDGVIDLDEPIGSYWDITAQNPSYPDTPITIRTLLSHSSSLKVLSWDVSRSRDNVRKILQSGNSYMKSAPGTSGAWGYNNYGFGVLGQTLELASGKYLDEILSDRLWSVMGIDSAFESGSVKDTDKLATLYENGKVYTSHKALLRNVRPSTLGATGDNYSGGMTISAGDLAKMAALLVNDGQYEGLRLMSEESIALMEADSGLNPSDGIPQAYPLRWREGLYGRDKLYYHTGSGYGVYNLLSYDPVSKDAVVVLTTGASGRKDSKGIYAVCSEVSQFIYDTIK